jgi:hypothetical protein
MRSGEGLSYIRSNPTIGWSLVYLGIAAGLIGVLGVIGPAFAEESLGLETEDVWVIVLPLGAGVVLGVLALNSYGRYLPRRRLIEVGLIVVGVLVALLSVAGPISRFLQGVSARQPVVDRRASCPCWRWWSCSPSSPASPTRSSQSRPRRSSRRSFPRTSAGASSGC